MANKNVWCPIGKRPCDGTGTLCAGCPHKDKRKQSASRRGYDYQWRKIRTEVLTRAGIPVELHHLYDVDHNPPYDPITDPDHRHYVLIPRLHADHSAKTLREDVIRSSDGKIMTSRVKKGVGGEISGKTHV